MYVEGIFLENTKMTKINCSFNHFTILNLISAHDFFFFFFGGGGGVSGVFISACWVILHAFYHLLNFSKLTFFKKFFQEYHQSVVGPDLGPNCLQSLSADDKSPN